VPSLLLLVPQFPVDEEQVGSLQGLVVVQVLHDSPFSPQSLVLFPPRQELLLQQPSHRPFWIH
jgi:hypothetical protein